MWPCKINSHPLDTFTSSAWRDRETVGGGAGVQSPIASTIDACVRTSDLAMKRAGAIFAVWEKVKLSLVMSGTTPTLLVATKREQQGGHGRFFTDNVSACPIPVGVKDSQGGSSDTFLLTLGSSAGTFIVQAESEMVAHRWIHSIQQAFSKSMSSGGGQIQCTTAGRVGQACICLKAHSKSNFERWGGRC
ncbi:hypothetical protein BCR44DRAFT_1191066 [Catenaria anguillulae PL171]|uniref:PH domain-containing protein n=1 Tax=Catenaria anguillulae PL171 TaxID=765915 RepID=A0A1Y2HJC8_9FUNG|nr:hypothetical protein BCR44DRAFT_1191066 [Catenaria anguillulae PL171]